MGKIKIRCWDTMDKCWMKVNEMPERLFQDEETIYTLGESSMVNFQLFTGICDKHGRDIYEGDIVREGRAIGKVEYYRNRFLVMNTDGSVYSPSESGEVVGNIYENSDLLGE